MLQEEPWPSCRYNQVPDVGRQEPQRQQKRTVTEFFMALLLPHHTRDEEHYGQKQRVDNLEELSEARRLQTFQPDRGIGVPEGEIKVCQEPVSIGVPDGGDQDGHFPIREKSVRKWIPIVKIPASPAAEFDRHHNQS